MTIIMTHLYHRGSAVVYPDLLQVSFIERKHISEIQVLIGRSIVEHASAQQLMEHQGKGGYVHIKQDLIHSIFHALIHGYIYRSPV